MAIRKKKTLKIAIGWNFTYQRLRGAISAGPSEHQPSPTCGSKNLQAQASIRSNPSQQNPSENRKLKTTGKCTDQPPRNRRGRAVLKRNNKKHTEKNPKKIPKGKQQRGGGSGTPRDKKRGEGIELPRARESALQPASDFDFQSGFLRGHWGLCFVLLGRATARTDGVVFALAPRVAPSNQKASGGHGNGEHPSPSGTSAGGLPTDKCAVHASANLEKQNTLSLFARAPGTWRLLLP